MINQKKYVNAALLFLSAAFVFTVRLLMLLKSSEPAGLDGYFYALQAKSFMLHGVLENPDYKTGYYFCGIFAWLFRNPVLGCKIYASLISTVMIYGVYSVLSSLKVRSRLCFIAAMLTAGLFSVSSMCINFINNLTGLAFFLFYVSSLLKAGKKLSGYILPAVLFVFCVLSHLVSAAFAFLFTVFYVLNRLSLKKSLCFLIAALAAASFIFIRQIPRFKGVFSFLPVLPVFSRFMRNAAGIRISSELSVIFILSWTVFISALIRGIKARRFNFIYLMIPALFFPFWNLNVLDMGYRMLLSAVPCGLMAVFYELNFFIQRREKPQPENTCAAQKKAVFFQLKKPQNLIFAAIIVLLIPFVISSRASYNEKRDPPYAYYRKVVRNIELPDDSLLIAHLGLNHVYTYYKNLRDALNYVPDFYVPEEKLWRLAFGVSISAVEDVLSGKNPEFLEKNVRVIDSNYILIREDLWEEFLEKEDEEIAENFKNWYNPHEVRPDFIRKSKNKNK